MNRPPKSRPERLALLSKLDFREGKRCHTWFDTLREPEAAGLRSLRVHLMGQSILRPPYVACRPESRFELMLFPVAGSMQLMLPSRTTSIGPGEIWLIPAGALSRMQVPRGTFEMAWIHLDPGALPLSLHGGEAVRLSTDLRAASQMHSWAQFLRWEHSAPRGDSRQFRLHVYGLIQMELERLLHPEYAQLRAEALLRVRQAWEAAEADTSERWDVAGIARLANLSSSRFYALCVAHFGMTPQQRLTQIRMNRAAGLLLSSNEKVETIATDCGYSTLFAFSKAFKKVFGVSPRSFRENRLR